jgi:hypothetical protein
MAEPHISLKIALEVAFFFVTGLCARFSLRGEESQAYTTDHGTG